MFKKKYDLAIVNRSFWPQSEILGGAKLRLAEKIAVDGRACVITQAQIDIIAEAKNQGRGKNVRFYVAKSRSDSGSGLVRRIFDALLFGPFVFWSLCKSRPKHVYVSTNPPVVVPFLVYLYCKLYRAKYTYHLQDIHPEIVNLVTPMNKLIYRILRGIDNITLRNADKLITLSTEMSDYLKTTSQTRAPIYLLDNPGFSVSQNVIQQNKIEDVVFCGNAGRVQEIPSLLEGINLYLNQGGRLRFTFIGGGIYASKLEELSKTQVNVKYLGYLKPSKANGIVSKHRWAILPIQDEVTRFAFPSKSSSYLASGCRILGICSPDTSVAKWIDRLDAGVHVPAVAEKIAEALWNIELQAFGTNFDSDRENQIKKVQTVADFVESMEHILKLGK